MKKLLATLFSSTLFIAILVFAFLSDKIFIYDAEKAKEALKILSENLADNVTGKIAEELGVDVQNLPKIDTTQSVDQQLEQAVEQLTEVVKEGVVNKAMEVVEDNVSQALEAVSDNLTENIEAITNELDNMTNELKNDLNQPTDNITM